MADVLYELLDADESWDKVTYVVDKKKSGMFHAKDIISEVKVKSGDVVIVTPVYRTKELINDVISSISTSDARVISLREWLKNIK